MTALGSILFFILAPGMVAGFIPLGLLRNGSQVQTGLLAYLAFPLWGIGLVTLIWCFWNLLIYAVLVFLVFNSLVVFYEEPTLKSSFGAEYEEYLKRVPRWIPRFR